jgi:UDP-glucuronate 4-epimerase
MSPVRFMITGVAGFIGFHMARRLLDQGQWVIGVDDLNESTDPFIKHQRLTVLLTYPSFVFHQTDIADADALLAVFAISDVKIVLHFAAMTGVRASSVDPQGTIRSNVVGFANLLEACRIHKIDHLFYASSSSVYGKAAGPMTLNSDTDHPLSLYAATKKADELMAQVYSTSTGLCSTGLRFFSVYGPYGRPDMAVYQFSKKIRAHQPITVFDQGRMARDFTYIDDLIEALDRLIDKVLIQAPVEKHRCFNVGHGNPIGLMTMIKTLEDLLGQKAILIMGEANPYDPPSTCADTSALIQEIGPLPVTSIDEGLQRFVEWFNTFES